MAQATGQKTVTEDCCWKKYGEAYSTCGAAIKRLSTATNLVWVSANSLHPTVLFFLQWSHLPDTLQPFSPEAVTHASYNIWLHQ